MAWSHGPYKVVEVRDPDVAVKKHFFPEEGTIRVHQLRACPCPQLPIGYYWYGENRHSTSIVPRWVEKLLQSNVSKDTGELTESSTTQCEDGAAEKDQPSDSDGQPPDDVITDQDNLLPEQPESPEKPTINEDENQHLSKTPRYNLRDPSTKTPYQIQIKQVQNELLAIEGGDVTVLYHIILLVTVCVAYKIIMYELYTCTVVINKSPHCTVWSS